MGLSPARPAERTVARQEAVEHERDKVRHRFPPTIRGFVGVGIFVQRLEHVGHHADADLDRGSVVQLRSFEVSHFGLPMRARLLYPSVRRLSLSSHFGRDSSVGFLRTAHLFTPFPISLLLSLL